MLIVVIGYSYMNTKAASGASVDPGLSDKQKKTISGVTITAAIFSLLQILAAVYASSAVGKLNVCV